MVEKNKAHSLGSKSIRTCLNWNGAKNLRTLTQSHANFSNGIVKDDYLHSFQKRIIAHTHTDIVHTKHGWPGGGAAATQTGSQKENLEAATLLPNGELVRETRNNILL